MHILNKKDCKLLRALILEMTHKSGGGHVPSSFSIVELVAASYNFFKKNYGEFLLDDLIISKGHAVYALYALMKKLDILNAEEYKEICNPGSWLIGHIPLKEKIGLTYGTGSLGYGLPFAMGANYGKKNKSVLRPKIIIIGDGELNEGLVWESILLFEKFENLGIKLIIDWNNSSERAVPLSKSKNALIHGWNAIEVDGHCISEIFNAISKDNLNQIIIANTIKGFPVKELSNNPAWHHRAPSLEEYNSFLEELG